MRFELDFDPAKRILTLVNRGLDFLDCDKVFSAPHLQLEDDRQDYGERHFIVFGWLDARRVVVAWPPRVNKRRIISMRYAHAEEFAPYERNLDRP